MLKLRDKWTLLVVIVELAALLFSSGISAIVSAGLLTEQIRSSEHDLAALVLNVQQEGQLPLSRYEDLFRAHSTFRLEFPPQQPSFSADQLALLGKGELVSTGRGHNLITYFYLDGRLAAILPAELGMLESQSTLRWLITALLMFVIGLAAMWLLAMRISDPIVALTDAARRVADGDFTAKVPLRRQTKKRPYDEIEELTATFNRMTDELKSIEYLRKDFTSCVSHEIKSPIAAISGYAQLLSDETLDADTRRSYTRSIRDSCTQLSHLSENLLRITRLESGKRKPLAEAFSLDEQLRRMVAAMMPEFRRKRHELTVELESAGIVSDRELLGQVWQNLLSNAIKFTPEDGHIAVTLTKRDALLAVCIRDDGAGIPAAALPHIFEKFYQADGSHHTEGSGLGLSLVRRILDACGGEISVESAPGCGSAFTVTLPVRRSNEV